MTFKIFNRIIYKPPEYIIEYLKSLYSLSRIKIITQCNGIIVLSFVLSPKEQLTGISVSLSLMKLPINSSYALSYLYEDNLLIKNYKLLDALRNI